MANIYVTAIEGGSCSLGTIPAVVDVVCNLGIISEISGLLIHCISGNQNGWYHEHQLTSDDTHCSDRWGWPTGVGCLPFDRNTNFPNGFQANYHSMTGHVMSNGNTLTSFGREG